MKKVKGQMSESLVLGLLLALAGGFFDAYTYLCRGGVFANAETGNIVLLGAHLAEGDFEKALRYLLPIVAFAFGVLSAELVKRRFKSRQNRDINIHWRQIVVLGEMVLVTIAALLPQSANAMVNIIISFVCAMQVETFRKVRGSAFATTMCTGNLRDRRAGDKCSRGEGAAADARAARGRVPHHVHRGGARGAGGRDFGRKSMNIRLIAADMDGTLLDSRKQLPEGLFPLVRALHERGVRFAPASGRQFYTLYEQFGEIADELMYISENGAMICDGSECVGFSAMPREVVLDAIERVRTLPGVYMVISARSGAFYEKNSSAEAVRNFNMYCARCTEVPDLAEFASREPICKVALFCAGRAEQVLMPAFAGFAGRAQLALSGTDWVDLMRTGVSKGGALEELCGTLGITTADCMAFGDYLNDIELLRTAGESYAMANAHEQLAALAKYRCPSNDEDGVCRTIRAVFDL